MKKSLVILAVLALASVNVFAEETAAPTDHNMDAHKAAPKAHAQVKKAAAKPAKKMKAAAEAPAAPAEAPAHN